MIRHALPLFLSVEPLADVVCYTLTDEAMNKLNIIYDKVVGKEDFGNGRFVRKMIEAAELNLAKEETKAAATYVTDDIDNDGWAKGIAHFNLI